MIADPDEWHPSRILVETPASGPTQREDAKVLREIAELADGGFGWGHNGSSTSRTAAVVLADALDLDLEAVEFGGIRDGDPLGDLREDFCAEVLTDLCDEWRLNRRALVRWAAGWYHQRGITDAPPLLRDPRWVESV
ncbi:hypothetical protein ND748_01015 [Frankia sp. AiPs1]|uniref:hypothetical protein n=1 Tax=Frankia sp. AiPs1 TaxID=573493 RepID=UPI0020445A24|nr:hypothetical protein [Frankia sp. AiPs1]MCM3920270.1 hypothetical protein [Frankia sp. AiPs1]